MDSHRRRGGAEDTSGNEEPQLRHIEAKPEGHEKVKPLTITHEGKQLVFAHLDNRFYPNFTFFTSEERKRVCVPWNNLLEAVRGKIRAHIKQQKREEPSKQGDEYDLQLYRTLCNPPSAVSEVLKEQARRTAALHTSFSAVTSRMDTIKPTDLVEEVALEIAKAKKSNTEWGRTFIREAQPIVFKWLTDLRLNPKHKMDRISVDFSDSGKNREP
ncbi:MAG: hypothetical protein FJY77_00445 [Candidatus Altiarchaeales archaeon]|nr:hypothetical protein [Candidatus Altiarchaeales archaeon]